MFFVIWYLLGIVGYIGLLYDDYHQRIQWSGNKDVEINLIHVFGGLIAGFFGVPIFLLAIFYLLRIGNYQRLVNDFINWCESVVIYRSPK